MGPAGGRTGTEVKTIGRGSVPPPNPRGHGDHGNEMGVGASVTCILLASHEHSEFGFVREPLRTPLRMTSVVFKYS